MYGRPGCGSSCSPPGSPILSGMGRGRMSMDEAPPQFTPNVTSTPRIRKLALARSPPPRRRRLVDEMAEFDPMGSPPAGQRVCTSTQCAPLVEDNPAQRILSQRRMSAPPGLSRDRRGLYDPGQENIPNAAWDMLYHKPKRRATAPSSAPFGQHLIVDPFLDTIEEASRSELEVDIEPAEAPLPCRAPLNQTYTVPSSEAYTGQEVAPTCPAALNQTYTVPSSVVYTGQEVAPTCPAALNQTYTVPSSEAYTGQEVAPTCPAALNQTYTVPESEAYMKYQDPCPAVLNNTYTVAGSEVCTPNQEASPTCPAAPSQTYLRGSDHSVWYTIPSSEEEVEVEQEEEQTPSPCPAAAPLEIPAPTCPASSRRAYLQRPKRVPIPMDTCTCPVTPEIIVAPRRRRLNYSPPGRPQQGKPGTLLQIGRGNQ